MLIGVPIGLEPPRPSVMDLSDVPTEDSPIDPETGDGKPKNISSTYANRAWLAV